jgi:hypothetical protein
MAGSALNQVITSQTNQQVSGSQLPHFTESEEVIKE